MNSSDISAYIIAGGKSSRFGEDKTLYMFRDRPLIEHVVEAIRPVIERITIIGDASGKFDRLGLPSHGDIISGIGPLGGLHTALKIADTDRIFVFACDMPGLNSGLIRHMSYLDIGSHHAIVPVIDGFYEPLHAVYSKTCLGIVEHFIGEGKHQLVKMLKGIDIRVVTEKEIGIYADPKTIFRNINLRNDLHDLQSKKYGNQPMHDHVNYFNDNIARPASAGILSDDLIRFYRDLFDYLDTHRARYLDDARMPVLQAGDLPLAGHATELFSAPGIGKLLHPGLAPLMGIVTSFNTGLDLKNLHAALTDDRETLIMAADAVLNMDMERLEQFAVSHKTGPDEAVFIIVNWLKPFLVSLREKNAALLADDDKTSLCPFCGSRPDMAAIVTGMDGKRILHCSLCGHRWQYRRIACAICGTEDASQLEYFSSEEDLRYRIDVCNACGGYIKTVRLQKFEEIDDLNLVVENVLTAHLDSAAMQKGYKKP